jgi:hypothetical protein
MPNMTSTPAASSALTKLCAPFILLISSFLYLA